ncbi:MAG: hypothetical protein CMC04_04090 [Flavobacteriaceae bacterium]|nr:hypothetical protein [Flavobacteriaceae bacterium]
MNKNDVLIGIISGGLATISCVIFLTLLLSDLPVEDSWINMHENGKLGGLISLGSLINLLIFLIAIKKNKISFATGLVIISLIIVLLISFIKIL